MSGSLVPHTPSALELAPDGGSAVQSWGPPAAPAPANAGGVNVGRFIAALRRYWWLIAIFAVVGAIGGFVATRFIKPTYIVDSTIVIGESPDPKGAVRPINVMREAAWKELLLSFAILDPVARKTRMYITPKSEADSVLFRGFEPTSDLRPGTYILKADPASKRFDLAAVRGRDEASVDKGVLGDSVGRTVGFAWAPEPSLFTKAMEMEFEVRTPREAANELRTRLSTFLPLESKFLKVQLKGQRSQELAVTMNSILSEFISEAAALKRKNLTDERIALQEQYEQAEATLQNVEGDLERLKTKNAGEMVDNVVVMPQGGGMMTNNPALADFMTQRIEQNKVRRDREAVQALLGAGGGARITPEAVLSIPGVAEASPNLKVALEDLTKQQAELRRLKDRYTDEHPLVVAKQADIDRMETQTIPSITRGSLDQLQRKENELGRRLSAAAPELRAIPQRTIQEAALTRERDLAAGLYGDLKNRYNFAKLAEASAIPDVSVLDSAVAPLRPASNTAPMILLLSIGGALGLAIIIAILLDLFDKRFRYPEQATHELGLDILGTIPSIRRGRDGATRLEDEAQLVEAFRGLRLNVRNAANGTGPVTLAISSPGPGDGKSLISSNLALAFAEAGYRTLLIDGDIRRGQLHSTFDVPQRPGFVDHLTGDVVIEDVIRETSHANLFVIPCGTRRHRGPELLAADSTVKMIRSLRSRFDAIIVDTAPLGAGIDPYALGAAAGTMMLVLRTGQTDRKLAQAKLTTLDRLPIRLIGAVLNDIQTEGMYKYYSYLDGYGTLDEDDEPRLVQAGAEGNRLPARRE
jgi:capsular exopolysaccharide synthesis family protein